MIKAVYFDLDGVLFDRDKAERVTLEYINQNYLQTIENDKLSKIWKEINISLWNQCCQKIITAENVLIERWREMIEAIGLRTPISLERLAHIYLENYTSPIYKIELSSVLDMLKKEKYLMAVITNGVQRVQNLKIKKMNLEDYFDYVVTDQDSGFRKPDTRMFEYALSLHNLRNNEAIYIGDSYMDDIVPTQLLGMTSILFCNKNNVADEKYVFYKAHDEVTLNSIMKELLR